LGENAAITAAQAPSLGKTSKDANEALLPAHCKRDKTHMKLAPSQNIWLAMALRDELIFDRC
jgi:hypothetical protein